MSPLLHQVTHRYLVEELNSTESPENTADCISNPQPEQLTTYWSYVTWKHYPDGRLSCWEYYETADDQRTLTYVSDEVQLGMDFDPYVLAGIPMPILHELGIEAHTLA